SMDLHHYLHLWYHSLSNRRHFVSFRKLVVPKLIVSVRILDRCLIVWRRFELDQRTIVLNEEAAGPHIKSSFPVCRTERIQVALRGRGRLL
ncbi:hypothetical protein PMAYCL1PPCAC_03021, partial [Pristionchus mayeri]